MIVMSPTNSPTIHDSPFTRHGFFVTGTDTGVGKTLVACALLHAFAERNLRVVGMKPVAAGAELQDGRLVNDDVKALNQAGNVAAPHELVNPYCFRPPIAPHIAAAEAGIVIELERVMHAYRRLAATADCVVVEGAGGFLVPLSPHRDTSDLAVELGLPLILVVGMRLGCLNHALLTEAAIRSAGLRLAGWVANHIDAQMTRSDENVAVLRTRLHAPLLARIPYGESTDATRVARQLRVDLLQ